MVVTEPAPTPSTTTPAADAAVVARELGFAYKGRRALDGVDFEVPVGSVYGFLGPNGAGKSTLFRLLATLLPVAEGRVHLLGHDLASEPAAVRRLLGITFQTPSLDLRLTVAENLRHHGHLYGLSGKTLSAAIGEQLERFGLADRRGERAEKLSGGLRRRVELAKTLLSRPRLLLLDEPSTGLDPRARRELQATLGELAAEGTTVLLTTHFIEEAERCDRLLVLDHGRTVAEGTPAELVAEIGGEVVTLEGRDAAALAADVATELGDGAESLQVAAREVRFEIGAGTGGAQSATWGTVARLARRLPGWEERVSAVTVARPDLEDVFLHRTGRPFDDARRGEEEAR
jgi:ABC-2 type transport system ATP-binding protein